MVKLFEAALTGSGSRMRDNPQRAARLIDIINNGAVGQDRLLNFLLPFGIAFSRLALMATALAFVAGFISNWRIRANNAGNVLSPSDAMKAHELEYSKTDDFDSVINHGPRTQAATREFIDMMSSGGGNQT